MALIVLPHVDWRKPKDVWNMETVKTTIPAPKIITPSPRNNLGLAEPNYYLLLRGFNAIDLFKLAICVLYVK